MTASNVVRGPAERQGKIQIAEVMLRDGLQNEDRFVSTERKIELADGLGATGIAKLEVTSFVSPRAIPALRDAEEVMSRIERRDSVRYTVLVPNRRGAERALGCGPDEINVVMSMSESHNLANLRMLREQSFRELSAVIAMAQAQAIACTVSLSCSFGCPMEGEVPAETVLDYARRFIEVGASAIAYCDTTGMAYPRQVFALCSKHRVRFPDRESILHLHNTRGLAIANVMAGLAAGVVSYDASLGGLGGCPYAPGATGNLCTEDLVHFLALQGFETGVDLSALLQLSRSLPGIIGHETAGQVAKAGGRGQRFPLPAGFDQIKAKALERERAGTV